jgi:hypothetical protein
MRRPSTTLTFLLTLAAPLAAQALDLAAKIDTAVAKHMQKPTAVGISTDWPAFTLAKIRSSSAVVIPSGRRLVSWTRG